MLRGSTVLFTYALSIFYLHVTIKRQKVVGCLIVFVGLAIIGLVNYLYSTGSAKATADSMTTFIGYALILVGALCTGLVFVY
jgi:drug/metabolite transporter (DMT)-like permease